MLVERSNVCWVARFVSAVTKKEDLTLPPTVFSVDSLRLQMFPCHCSMSPGNGQEQNDGGVTAWLHTSDIIRPTLRADGIFLWASGHRRRESALNRHSATSALWPDGTSSAAVGFAIHISHTQISPKQLLQRKGFSLYYMQSSQLTGAGMLHLSS